VESLNTMTTTTNQESDVKSPVTLHKVGVYGTLKWGYHRHISLGRAVQVGTTFAPGVLLHLGGFPALVEQIEGKEFRPNNTVLVEIYEVDQKTLDSLDEIEGHPGFYERRIVKSQLFGDVWVYYGHTDSYLMGGEQKIIVCNKWSGPETPYLYVDFKQGKEKPAIKMGLKKMIRASDGSYKEISVGHPTGEKPVYTESYTKEQNPLTVGIKWERDLNCYTNKAGQYLQWDAATQTYKEIEKPKEPEPLPITTVKVPTSLKPLTGFPEVINGP